jgi:hypothetical protein
MTEPIQSAVIALGAGVAALAGQAVIVWLKERWRRGARREAYAELVFAERLRAHLEIAGLAAGMIGLEGRSRLATALLSNSLVLSRETIRLINAVVFSPPGDKTPATEFLKAYLDLVNHLREELGIEAIHKEELSEILRGPKHGEDS